MSDLFTILTTCFLKLLSESKILRLVTLQLLDLLSSPSSFTLLYGEGINFFFFSPNISYEINESLDASIIGQFFYMDDEFNSDIPIDTNVAPINIINRINGYYARLKWSF